MKLNFQSNKTQTVNIGNARNVSLLKTSSLDESRNIGLGKSQRRRNKSASNISGPKSTLKGHKFSISSRPQRNAIVASSNNQTTADSLHLSLNSVCSLSERTREHQNCGSPLDAVKNVTRVGPLSTPGSSGTRNTFESQQTEDFTNSTASTLQSSSNCNNCQIKGTIASDKTSINVKPELQLKNLKEWTLCHLNLAQEQQSIIDDKDKLIAELRAENLALKTRLERMDRRLVTKSTATTPSNTVTTGESPLKQVNSTRKKFNREATPDESSQSFVEDKHRTRSSEKPVNQNKLKLGIKSAIEENLSCRRLHGKSSSLQTRLLEVEKDYYTCQVHEFEELHEETIPNCRNAQSIEVPSFRVQTYSNCYSLEGTEDTEDLTYLKRHQRHESDEKKRKRWDLQRQRERQVIEKLKQNQHPKSASSAREVKVEAIFPRAESMEYIEVCDTLPVSVFGHAVDYLPPSEFSLPWYNPSKGTNPSARKRRRRV
ncbi:hypothetical protein EB796_025304 [Bugula neritina]|uniref:PEHE domain-containing protein n=1 Tax=Bugula neritina TaxID=10212 RepID=A0A7J7IR99_BUGNE|nr:hypothetical protein EB796_025304 [Bugula neritina]